MNIIINGRHLEITPAIRDYVESKINKFDKFLSKISEAIVTLRVDKYRHKAEVLIKANGVLIQAESITGEIYSSIDEVVEKLERQIKKYREKITSHRKDNRKSSQTIPAGAKEEAAGIIKKKKFDMKPMNPEEAIMQMDLLDKDFFVYTNDKSGDINVVYRRNDGNYGLIEPSK